MEKTDSRTGTMYNNERKITWINQRFFGWHYVGLNAGPTIQDSGWVYGCVAADPVQTYHYVQAPEYGEPKTSRIRVWNTQPKSKEIGAYVGTLKYDVYESKLGVYELSSSLILPTDCGPSTFTAYLVGTIPWGTAVTGSDVVNTQYRAQHRLVQRISDQKVMAYVTAAESGKTLSMLKDIVQTIHKAVVQAKRGDFTRALKTLGRTKGRAWRRPGCLNKAGKYTRRCDHIPDADDLANQWLRIRYGITPLLYDVVGIAEQLANDHFGQGEPLQTFRASSSNERVVPVPFGGAGGTYAGYYLAPGVYGDLTNSTEVLVRTWALVKLVNPGLRSTHEWGLLNPTQALYELTPLSFVADWLFTVGDYLASLDYDVGFELIDAGRGTMTKTTVAGQLWTDWEPGNKVPVSSFRMEYHRIKLDSFAAIKPNYWHIRDNMNWKKYMDAVALLKALTRKDAPTSRNLKLPDRL